MDSEGRRRGVDGDDSLLASVAGVPLTRMARIAVCVIWAGFWAARILLTGAMSTLARSMRNCYYRNCWVQGRSTRRSASAWYG